MGDLEKRLRGWSRIMRAADLPKHPDDHRVADLLQEAAEALAGLPEREGWVLVPREPTEEMLDGVLGTNTCVSRHAARIIFGAMLRAAPKP